VRDSRKELLSRLLKTPSNEKDSLIRARKISRLCKQALLSSQSTVYKSEIPEGNDRRSGLRITTIWTVVSPNNRVSGNKQAQERGRRNSFFSVVQRSYTVLINVCACFSYLRVLFNSADLRTAYGLATRSIPIADLMGGGLHSHHRSTPHLQTRTSNQPIKSHCQSDVAPHQSLPTSGCISSYYACFTFLSRNGILRLTPPYHTPLCFPSLLVLSSSDSTTTESRL
jgi:hypothetical protein